MFPRSPGSTCSSTCAATLFSFVFQKWGGVAQQQFCSHKTAAALSRSGAPLRSFGLASIAEPSRGHKFKPLFPRAVWPARLLSNRWGFKRLRFQQYTVAESASLSHFISFRGTSVAFSFLFTFVDPSCRQSLQLRRCHLASLHCYHVTALHVRAIVCGQQQLTRPRPRSGTVTVTDPDLGL